MGEADRTRGDLSRDRAEQQARSIAAALRGRSLSEGASARVTRAVALAMARRSTLLTDDHHPAYLHPGRSVLILLHDVEDLPEEALPLAALHESQDAELRVPSPVLDEPRPGGFTRLPLPGLARLPLPGSEGLEERLVLLDRAGALAVLAERLDHLRHLHLRDDLRDTWGATHEEVLRAWRPFAHRTDGRLAVRFDHWTRVFAKRLRQRPRV